MRSVLVIGLDPATVPGFDPEPVKAALHRGSARFPELDLTEDQCLIDLGRPDPKRIIDHLNAKPYDCVVVGGGIRKAEELLELFETVVNLVHRHAPQAVIAFNSNPTDSADAAHRALRN